MNFLLKVSKTEIYLPDLAVLCNRWRHLTKMLGKGKVVIDLTTVFPSIRKS